MQFPRIAVFSLINLAGCGAHVDDPQSPPRAGEPSPQLPAAESIALTEVDENLARLRALEVFEVGDLVVKLPDEATPAFEDAVRAARTQAAERLATLADTAERAAATPYSAYACGARVDANLEVLRSLDVVGIGAFLRSVPENNPLCDNQPCAEDVAAANAKDEARATELESIALAVEHP